MFPPRLAATEITCSLVHWLMVFSVKYSIELQKNKMFVLVLVVLDLH